ncbi:MAG TPA: hypothetical protein VN669_17615 [Candidatus Acidoferrales bacterium]|jgi:hypothetical protein|nr:hypothetical protein [Candidatus Acidoferrales bacterium]
MMDLQIYFQCWNILQGAEERYSAAIACAEYGDAWHSPPLPRYWRVLRAALEFISGMLVCWLLNLVQLGIAFVLLSSSEKNLPAVYVLTTALGLVQLGYVIPIYHVLLRWGRRYAGYGLLTAACSSLLSNAVIDYHLFGPAMFQFWR